MSNKVVALLMLFWVLSFKLEAQVNKYAFGDSIFVWASSLNLRESPGPNAKIVGKVAYGSIVVIIDKEIGKVAYRYKAVEKQKQPYQTTHYEERRVDENTTIHTPTYQYQAYDYHTYDLDGFWVKVNFEGTIGYVFDGYLSKLKPFSTFMKNDGYNLQEWAIKTHQLALSKKVNQTNNDMPRVFEKEFGSPTSPVRVLMGCEKCYCREIQLKGGSLEEGKMLGFQIFGPSEGACETSVFLEKDYLVIYCFCCC